MDDQLGNPRWSALALMLVGAGCMLAGVIFLLLNAISPQHAVGLLPQTPAPFEPTEGVLFQTPLAPPPMPQQAQIPIMPAMAVAALDPITPEAETPSPIPATSVGIPTLSPVPIMVTATIMDVSTELPLDPISPLEEWATTQLAPTSTLTAIPFITPTLRPTLIPLQPVQVDIPSIDLHASIQPVWLQQVVIEGRSFSQWRVPNGRVVGWHDTSAKMGEVGNLVLNGHHNIEGRVFANLIQVQVGDEIRLGAADQSTRRYTVVQTMLLEEEGQPPEQRLENARWLLPSYDERITLVTCWPPDGRSHRLVVVALPSELVEGSQP